MSTGCEFEHPHDDHPCGLRVEVPGTPCRHCGAPVPLDGSACPRCWQVPSLPLFRGWMAAEGIDTTVVIER